MLLDVHGHPPRERAQLPAFITALERFDSRLLVAELGARGAGWGYEPSVEHWQQGNALCAELVRQFPERLAGYCYVNPAHGREALAEMERRLLGEPDTFAALKLWVAVRCSDPRLDPLMEFCAAHQVPVLQHTWMKVGPGGPGSGNLPGESTPEDLLKLARRHPHVKFFGGHVGGDWEWGIAAFKQVDNVWLDVAGGDATGGYMELALRHVGAGRIVFGTDVPGRSVPSQLAKILGVDLPDADLERILWRNAAGVLGSRLPAAWQTAGDAHAGGATAHRPTLEGHEEQEARRPALGGHEEQTAQRAAFRNHGEQEAQRAAGRAPSWSAARLPRVPEPGEGGLVDANSFLGEWPSRRLNGSAPHEPRASVDRRLAAMDRRGIRRAAVSLLDGVWLKDAGEANAGLRALVQRAPGRFFPAYVVNPTFPDWRQTLDRCVEDYDLARGAGALRLHPGYHGYRLEDAHLDDLLGRLAALDLPVLLTFQLEDPRMHHPAMRVPDLDPGDVAALLNRWPSLRWIVTGATQAQILAIGRQVLDGTRAWFDLSRVQGPIDGIPILCAHLGARRLVFGTNVPLHVAESPIMELADARLSPEDDAAIRFGNALDALDLA